MKKYRVKLKQEERSQLEKWTQTGKVSVRKLKRIQALLLSDESEAGLAKPDQEIAEVLGLSAMTVSRVRQRYVGEGLEAAVNEKPRPGARRKFSGKDRAVVTALACSDPPDGYAKWSLRMLADKLVELELVESISHDSVREILKKTSSNLT